MFSRSQILSVCPRWGPYHLAFVLIVSSVSTVWLVAALGFSPTQRLEVGSKSFLLTSLCLI